MINPEQICFKAGWCAENLIAGTLIKPLAVIIEFASVILVIAAAAVTPALVITTIFSSVAPIAIVPSLEFLVSFIAIVVEIATTSVVAAFICPEGFHIRCIGKFKLAMGNVGKFTLDGIVMNLLFVPVVVCQFHIVGNGISEAKFLLGIFFLQCFVDDNLKVFAKMRELGIALGIMERFGLGFEGFSCRNGIWRIHIQLKVGNQEQVIPELMPEIFHVFEVRVQKAHQLNHGVGISLSCLPIFNGKQVFNHLLNMAAIFTHHQEIPRRVILHVR